MMSMFSGPSSSSAAPASGAAGLAAPKSRLTRYLRIEALRALPDATAVDLHTDSQYLRNGMSEWLARWKRNGWRTADRKPVKNEDLWRALDALAQMHQVRWHWVRGHDGHPENERCDALANAAIRERRGRDSDGSE